MNEENQRSIFQEWLDDYRALIFKVILAYAKDADDQNDLFQEVCLQVYRSIPNFKGASAISTWIYRISLNTAIKWSTKERKKTDAQNNIPEVTQALHTKEEPDERIAWLYHEIQQLNPVDRSLTLLLLEGYSYQEMASMMGISESNIGVKIHRIKKHLVKKSEKYDRYGV